MILFMWGMPEEKTLGRFAVTKETIDRVFELWRDTSAHLRWGSIFVLPPWLKAWWKTFGTGGELTVFAVWNHDELIGIAPCAAEGNSARLLGSKDVCDYLDVVSVPGREKELLAALIDYLRNQGIRHLALQPLRPDSVAMVHLPAVIQSANGTIVCRKQDVAVRLDLPPSWHDFLSGLSGRQRHEVRRKLRRLREAGHIELRLVSNPQLVEQEIETFLRLFTAVGTDKAHFMTDTMSSFFRSLARAMALENLLRLFFLDLNDVPVATALCFDYGSTRYLYNSGYNRRFQHLSVGLLCKVLSIQDSIARKQQRYDFLKGAEPYKFRLGGKSLSLYCCRADF